MEEKKKQSVGVLALRWIISILLLMVLLSSVFRAFSKAYYTRHIVITVTDKGVKRDKYMIYGHTVDAEHKPKSFEITDSVFRLGYDPSDLYADIDIGKTYEFIVGGNRIQFMGWYPNIYETTEVVVIDHQAETEAE